MLVGQSIDMKNKIPKLEKIFWDILMRGFKSLDLLYLPLLLYVFKYYGIHQWSKIKLDFINTQSVINITYVKASGCKTNIGSCASLMVAVAVRSNYHTDKMFYLSRTSIRTYLQAPDTWAWVEEKSTVK